MKKLVSTVIFTLVLGTAVMAQERKENERPRHTPEERTEHMTEKMSQELSLSETQKESIKAINLKYVPELRVLKEKDLPHEEKRKEIKPIKEAIAAEYKTVLTAEQWTTFEAKRQERHEHMKEHRKHHDGERYDHKKEGKHKACDKENSND